MLKEFDRRRRYMVQRLNAIPGIRCPMPTGAFYAFPNVSELFGGAHAGGKITSASDLASFLLDKAKVAVVAGDPFGSPAHVRLSYATGLDAITRGLDRMEAALKTLT
jgi:aspartate aminotransferase